MQRKTHTQSCHRKKHPPLSTRAAPPAAPPPLPPPPPRRPRPVVGLHDELLVGLGEAQVGVAARIPPATPDGGGEVDAHQAPVQGAGRVGGRQLGGDAVGAAGGGGRPSGRGRRGGGRGDRSPPRRGRGRGRLHRLARPCRHPHHRRREAQHTQLVPSHRLQAAVRRRRGGAPPHRTRRGRPPPTRPPRGGGGAAAGVGATTQGTGTGGGGGASSPGGGAGPEESGSTDTGGPIPATNRASVSRSTDSSPRPGGLSPGARRGPVTSRGAAHAALGAKTASLASISMRLKWAASFLCSALVKSLKEADVEGGGGGGAAVGAAGAGARAGAADGSSNLGTGGRAPRGVRLTSRTSPSL